MKSLLLSTFLLLVSSLPVHAIDVGAVEVRTYNGGGFTPSYPSWSNGQIIVKSGGVPTATTLNVAAVSGLQTALDAKLASSTAASTYEPIIGLGTLALNKLATDPLARANHTGTQAWSTITGTPTTLAGYGITDSITAALAASTYEPIITAGTTGQYWRGDKSWQTLNAAAVGLGNVENTALSTWTGSTNLATLGTITAGAWQGSIIAPAYLGTGSSITTKFLRGDGTWQTVESGLTIGTTTVTGGSNGNALIVADGILQQRGYSAGGGGALDGNKLATYDEDGKINTSSGFAVYQVADGLRYHVVLAQDLTATDHTITLTFGDADRAYTFPASGTLIGSNDTGTVTSTIIANSTIVDADISGSAAIAISKLASSSITIAGTATSLGGTITLDTITGLSTTGLVKRTGANTLAISSLNSNVETWLGTPTKTNLNAAVSDDDPAYVGTANTFTAAQTVGNGTVTSNTPVLSLSQTWNNASTAFDTMVIDVTNTASASSASNPSYWMRFKLAGTVKGGVENSFGSVAFNGDRFHIGSRLNAFANQSNVAINTVVNDVYLTTFWSTEIRLAAASRLTWKADSATYSGSADTFLGRGAAATIRQGDDVNGDAVDQVLKAADGITGADRSGADYHFKSGLGTGAGSVSALIFSTPTALGTGSTAQSYTERMHINSSGVKIGANGTAISHLKRTTATLVAGTATISDTDTTANTHVSPMVSTPGGTVGTLSVTVTAGVGYTITSSSALDTSTLVIKATHF